MSSDDDSINSKALIFFDNLYSKVSLESRKENHFILCDSELLQSEVTSAHGLFPVFVWMADQMHRQVTNVPFNISYRRNSNSLTGYEANLDTVAVGHSEVLLYLVEAFETIRSKLVMEGSNLANLDPVVGAFIDSMVLIFTDKHLSSPALESDSQHQSPNAP